MDAGSIYDQAVGIREDNDIQSHGPFNGGANPTQDKPEVLCPSASQSHQTSTPLSEVGTPPPLSLLDSCETIVESPHCDGSYSEPSLMPHTTTNQKTKAALCPKDGYQTNQLADNYRHNLYVASKYGNEEDVNDLWVKPSAIKGQMHEKNITNGANTLFNNGDDKPNYTPFPHLFSPVNKEYIPSTQSNNVAAVYVTYQSHHGSSDGFLNGGADGQFERAYSTPDKFTPFSHASLCYTPTGHGPSFLNHNIPLETPELNYNTGSPTRHVTDRLRRTFEANRPFFITTAASTKEAPVLNMNNSNNDGISHESPAPICGNPTQLSPDKPRPVIRRRFLSTCSVPDDAQCNKEATVSTRRRSLSGNDSCKLYRGSYSLNISNSSNSSLVINNSSPKGPKKTNMVNPDPTNERKCKTDVVVEYNHDETVNPKVTCDEKSIEERSTSELIADIQARLNSFDEVHDIGSRITGDEELERSSSCSQAGNIFNSISQCGTDQIQSKEVSFKEESDAEEVYDHLECYDNRTDFQETEDFRTESGSILFNSTENDHVVASVVQENAKIDKDTSNDVKVLSIHKSSFGVHIEPDSVMQARLQHEAIVSNMRSRHDTAIDNMEQKLFDLEEANFEKDSELQRLARHVKGLENLCEEQRLGRQQTVERLARNLDDSQAHCERLVAAGEEALKLTKDLADAKTAKELAQDKVKHLKEEVAELRAAMVVIKSNSNRFGSLVDGETDSGVEGTPDNDLMKNYQQKVQQVLTLQKDLWGKEGQIKEQIKKTEATTREMNIYKERLISQRENIQQFDQLRAQNEQLRSEIDELRQEVAQAKSREVTLEKENKTLTSHLEDLFTRLENSELAINHRCKNNYCQKQHDASMNELQDTLHTQFRQERDELIVFYQNAIEQIRASLMKTETENGSLRRLHSVACSEKDKLVRELWNQQHMTVDHTPCAEMHYRQEDEIRQLKMIIQKMELENQNLRGETGRLRSEMESYVNEKNKCEQDIKDCEARLKTVKKQRQEVYVAFKHQQKQYRALAEKWEKCMNEKNSQQGTDVNIPNTHAETQTDETNTCPENVEGIHQGYRNAIAKMKADVQKHMSTTLKRVGEKMKKEMKRTRHDMYTRMRKQFMEAFKFVLQQDLKEMTQTQTVALMEFLLVKLAEKDGVVFSNTSKGNTSVTSEQSGQHSLKPEGRKSVTHPSKPESRQTCGQYTGNPGSKQPEPNTFQPEITRKSSHPSQPIPLPESTTQTANSKGEYSLFNCSPSKPTALASTPNTNVKRYVLETSRISKQQRGVNNVKGRRALFSDYDGKTGSDRNEDDFWLLPQESVISSIYTSVQSANVASGDHYWLTQE